MGSAEPPGKMDEKLKSENMQKEQFLPRDAMHPRY